MATLAPHRATHTTVLRQREGWNIEVNRAISIAGLPLTVCTLGRLGTAQCDSKLASLTHVFLSVEVLVNMGGVAHPLPQLSRGKADFRSGAPKLNPS